MELIEIKNEINQKIGDAETFKSLVETTFNGLDSGLVKRALMEGMMRGYTFKDFLEKNVYAVPFGNKYSLVNSIDYNRKVGMRSGVVGKSAPTYTYEDMEEKTIKSCTLTIKKKVGEYIGDFTETVFFKEYNTGKQQWASKPHTMIAKVAEMHALRMACPEELSQSYIEEEYQRSDDQISDFNEETIDITDYSLKLESVTTLEELEDVWSDIPAKAKVDPTIKTKRDEMKAILDTEVKEAESAEVPKK